ncbi:MAG: hypothetical protein AB7O66_05680 [Limisphaerales bacterium]
MYPFNATPGSRPAAAVFGTLGDESGVDSRHGQFLLGFDLSGVAATNRGPDRYLVKRVSLSLVVSRDRAYPLDPTEDPMASYLDPMDAGSIPDEDPGRPVELFGVAYRNGFSASEFKEDSPFGPSDAGLRNAFAAGFGGKGRLVDVGNSVGKSSETFPQFDARPFALGQVEGWPSGEPVPAGSVMTFDLNLEDPWVLGYVREALNAGQLRGMVTSLHESGFGGAPTFAEFYTQDSVVGVPPSLEIEGTVIRELDTDGDGLPDDWEHFHLGGLESSGGDDDDSDGVSNLDEYRLGTRPDEAGDTGALSVARARDNGGIRIGFRHHANRAYRIEETRDGVVWKEAVAGTLEHRIREGRVVWEEAPGVEDPKPVVGTEGRARLFRVASWWDGEEMSDAR